MKRTAGLFVVAAGLTWASPARAQYLDDYASGYHAQLERLSVHATRIGALSLMVFADAWRAIQTQTGVPRWSP
jgi:hypothetical protein